MVRRDVHRCEAPNAERSRTRGSTLAWAIALMVVAAAGMIATLVQARRFAARYARARAETATARSAQTSVESQARSLQDRLDALTRAGESLKVDRDNLLSQNNRLTQEQTELSGRAELAERVLKHASEETRGLKEQLAQLQQDEARLQDLHATVAKDYDAMKTELAQAKKHTKEGQLTQQLSHERASHAKDLADLREARRRVQLLEGASARTKTETARLAQRLDVLQEKYAKELSANRTLTAKLSRMPPDITTMAREHERLLKDLADTHYNMGVVFVKQNDYTRAAREFQKVVELKPDDGDAHYNLGLIYAEHLPDRQKALVSFTKYLELNPNAQDASWVKHYIVSWRAWEAKERLLE